ncbi:helix-turn-helix domain-containing protein [Nocardioides sp.]|uniref:helix-turn-helix domain-containing protein n=1 Tax=Nocardioides sp. TaxID=35761 RepID=UPI0037843824
MTAPGPRDWKAFPLSYKRTLTLEDAGKQLEVSAKTVRRLIAAGHLRGTYIGRQVRVRPEDLDAYLDSASRPQSLRSLR